MSFSGPSYHIETFGCQMNENDSEKLAGLLEARGMSRAASMSSASLIVFNTCSVRGNANDKFLGRLGGAKALKGPGTVIAVCGCMMQEEGARELIAGSYPYVDIIFGTHNIASFPGMLDEFIPSRRLVSVLEDGPVEEFPSVLRMHSHKAYVTIMNGCDNFCSYCIVPYVRGREKSREAADILGEIAGLDDGACREITLLGQNVNSYGKGLSDPCTFSGLLRRTAQAVRGISRIRFLSSHPKDFSDGIISVMEECPQVCPSVHLPLQSGSDRVLSLMRRQYTGEAYLRTVEKLRARIPGVSVTADIIVGYPGETEEDFQGTLRVVSEARLDGAFTFIYSPREGTAAASMPCTISDSEIQDRFTRLTGTLYPIMLESNRRLTGTVQELLMDGPSRVAGVSAGRTRTNKLVNVAGEHAPGTLLPVMITSAKTFHLTGEPAGGDA